MTREYEAYKAAANGLKVLTVIRSSLGAIIDFYVNIEPVS